MKKYQWNDLKLKKKAQLYDWLLLGFAGVALVSSQTIRNGWLLLLLLVAAIICFVLSWRLKGEDTRLKVVKIEKKGLKGGNK